MRRAEDDGRTIAPMDALNGEPEKQSARPGADLTPAQLRHALGGATLAALAVALVFTAALVLFILFCTKVWLR